MVWRGIEKDAIYVEAGTMACILFLLIAETVGLYSSWRSTPLFQELKRIIIAWSSVILILTSLGFALKISDLYSRLTIGVWFSAVLVVFILWRTFWRVGLGYLRKTGRNTRTVAIAGAGILGLKLAAYISDNPWLGFRPVGFFDDYKPKGFVKPQHFKDGSWQILGNLEDLVAMAVRKGVDVIYVALPMRADGRIKEIVAKLANSSALVNIVPDLFLVDLLNAKWTDLAGIPTVSIFETPFHGVSGWVKRLEDIILSFVILLMLFIPMGFIAIGVKLSSPGPIIFRQRRYGIDGREIVVWKFRTMTCCEDDGPIKQAQKDDLRITRFGAFLRRNSLDEVLQFVNVLQGRMSLVGPRPHAVAHNEHYRNLIQAYMLRHKVKPGITGLAQIKGFRGETETLNKMEKRVDYDLEYIRRWSLFLDFKILVLTVVKGCWRGGY